MRIRLKEYDDTIRRAKEYIYDEMASVGIKVNDYMSEKSVVNYCNQYLVKRFTQNKPYHFDDKQKFNLITLKELFPSESLINAYIAYRECLSLKKRFESILKHEKNGYIQPTFAINSAGSIYTAKPALLLPHSELALYLNCDYYHFDTLDKAMNAILNAKADSEIITVIKKTVYFRNKKYLAEKEKKRHEAIKVMNENDFIPLLSYYDEFDFEYLGLNFLLYDDPKNNKPSK